MKREKDPRITISPFRSSLRIYLLMFVVFGLFNMFQIHLFLTLVENNLLKAEFGIDTLLSLLALLEYETPEMFFKGYARSAMLFTAVFTAILVAIAGVGREFLVTRPMASLGDAARRIAKGDFSARVTAPGIRKNRKKDTIVVLFDDFNTMTEELAAATEKLKALSVTDELTKLDNRRSFIERADMVWKQNHRLNLPVTLVVIDVDYFKKYNDTLGHQEGDKALIAIAGCLKEQIKRETDFVARLGGEEFVCLLPFLQKDEAFDFAKLLVRRVEEMKLPHPASDHSEYVTISAGMSTAVPNDKLTPAQLLEEADKALYEAKRSGRNQAVSA